MPALNYENRFATDVESGRKRSTIRAKRKHPIRIGQTLYHYTGMRTKACRKLREDICTMEREIHINKGCVKLDGVSLASEAIEKLAKADGFESKAAFYAYFEKAGFPFRGQLVEW